MPDPRLVLCTVAGLALALLWWSQGGWTFPLDDAYITIHNARVLIEGHDPNYGVPALVGATSLIHLALVTVFSLWLPGEAASFIVASFALIVFLSGLMTLARRSGLFWPEAIGLALVGVASGAGQCLNGLETGLVMAAVTWILILASDGPSCRLAWACGLLPFLRPELGLLSLTLLTRQAWLRLDAEADRVVVLRALAMDAGAVLMAAMPWLAWSLAETGTLVPQTIAAKQAFFGSTSPSLPEGLALATHLVAVGIGPVVVTLPFLGRTGSAWALWGFIALFVLGFALTTPHALAHNQHRYTFALLPIALLAATRFGATRGRRALFVVLAVQGTVALVCGTRMFAGQEPVRQYKAVAGWAQAHLPQAHLLIHDAGVVAAVTSLPLTDLVGLKSPDSVAEHRRWTVPSGGANRFRAVDAIARQSGATHAIILDDPPDQFWNSLVDDLRQAGWGVEPLYGKATGASYILYRLTPPAGIELDDARARTHSIRRAPNASRDIERH